MTAVTAPPQRRVRTESTYRLSFVHLLHSEWIKLWSLRSTWWSLSLTVLLSVGIALMIASASGALPEGYPAVSVILTPMQFTALVAGILGAMAITGEYSTGMIRSTLTAEPRRGAVLAAKAVTLALVMALTAVVSNALAIVASTGLLTDGIDWSTPEQSIIPLAYGVLSMIAFVLIGLGFGFLIRNGAGAIAATVGVLFVLPIVLSAFMIAGEGWQWLVDLADYLPLSAAAQLTSPTIEDVWPSLLSLLGWVVVPLVGGWAVLRSRDA